MEIRLKKDGSFTIEGDENGEMPKMDFEDLPHRAQEAIVELVASILENKMRRASGNTSGKGE